MAVNAPPPRLLHCPRREPKTPSVRTITSRITSKGCGLVDSSPAHPAGEPGRLPWITMKPLSTARPSAHRVHSPFIIIDKKEHLNQPYKAVNKSTARPAVRASDSSALTVACSLPIYLICLVVRCAARPRRAEQGPRRRCDPGAGCQVPRTRSAGIPSAARSPFRGPLGNAAGRPCARGCSLRFLHNFSEGLRLTGTARAVASRKIPCTTLQRLAEIS